MGFFTLKPTYCNESLPPSGLRLYNPDGVRGEVVDQTTPFLDMAMSVIKLVICIASPLSQFRDTRPTAMLLCAARQNGLPVTQACSVLRSSRVHIITQRWETEATPRAVVSSRKPLVRLLKVSIYVVSWVSTARPHRQPAVMVTNTWSSLTSCSGRVPTSLGRWAHFFEISVAARTPPAPMAAPTGPPVRKPMVPAPMALRTYCHHLT